MTGKVVVVTVITVLLMSTKTFARAQSASEILKKVAATYASMETYKARGMIAIGRNSGGSKWREQASFSILLKKPNLYRIVWMRKYVDGHGEIEYGAAWSDGRHPYVYLSSHKAYAAVRNDEAALHFTAGLSSGATRTLPSLFILPPIDETWNRIAKIEHPKIVTVMKIGGEDYYLIKGTSATSKRVSVWVSKKNYLIRKYCDSPDLPTGVTRYPSATEKQLEDFVRDVGGKVTEHNKKVINHLMGLSNPDLKGVALKGAYTEFQYDISFPRLEKSDFKFVPPEGTVRNDRMFYMDINHLDQLIGNSPKHSKR